MQTSLIIIDLWKRIISGHKAVYVVPLTLVPLGFNARRHCIKMIGEVWIEYNLMNLA